MSEKRISGECVRKGKRKYYKGLKKIHFYQSIMGKSGLETQIVESQFTISEKYIHQIPITSMSYFTQFFITLFSKELCGSAVWERDEQRFYKDKVYIKTKMTTASI